MQNAFVPKNRRPKFDLQLKIIDLNNVPLVSGTSYIKWHLPSSSSAEHRGRTSKAGIRDHKVSWEYVKTLPVRLTVDRNGMLQESEIHFEVLQEYSPGARAERIVLGNVKLNLAEFVGGSDDGEEAVTRRYLMQESKINSTLKIGVYMKQTEGDKTFTAPPLKTAPVFGGIAGIMTAEQADGDDGNYVPSMSSNARESGMLQDMYRRTLAASWLAQAGELPADKCIEDLFAGGDGWAADHDPGVTTSPRMGGSTEEDESDGDSRTLRGHKRHTSGTGSRGTIKPTRQEWKSSKNETGNTGAVSGRGSIADHIQSGPDAKNHAHRRMHEVDEFTSREDLRSWQISTND
ncbi:MAG: hypothetical protein ALECFALPRED_007622 [Alectoria fallacina]|uniref:C2 NT-type domain-containing protein n=1 Tax=Alectoria fallacina TaxID=1903189 RepID=A0A8H3G9H4_9LECA|nr:MAG: hypothetical protein ALECFALPRED_007622 [Alectoria fallacina]